MLRWSMPSPFSLSGVSERDLDVLFATHLTASEGFRTLVIQRTFGNASPHILDSCRVSVSTDAGETDLLVVLRLETGIRLALMLEHKIDAPFQPEQAQRYRQRGDQGIRDGAWNQYRTCLIAPQAYVAKVLDQDGWNGLLSLEEIGEWARSTRGPHEMVLAHVCSEAVAKHAKRASDVSPEATAFWQAYRVVAAKLLPELTITRLPVTVSRASPWPRFGADGLPQGVVLEHKPRQGRVDLTVSGGSAEQMQAATLGRLPIGIKVVRAAGSAALRLAVPRLDHLRPYDEQEEEVLAALAAVERLNTLGLSLLPEILSHKDSAR